MWRKFGFIAIVLISTADLHAQEKSLAQKNSEWFYDANGKVDSCKVGIPSPYANVSRDARAEFDRMIEACHQKKAAGAAASAERQNELAAQRAAEQAAKLQRAEGHKQYLQERHLTEVSVLDLLANGKDMVGGQISLTGYIRVFSEDKIAIYSNRDDINGVRLDVSEASPMSRRLIFGECSDIYEPCRLEITGTVAFDDHVLVQVQ